MEVCQSPAGQVCEPTQRYSAYASCSGHQHLPLLAQNPARKCQACCKFWGTDMLALVCKVSAFRRVKSKLGVGKEDKFSYGHSDGPSGVISVNVPNYQHRAQRQQALQQSRLVAQPVPQLPTPFAAAQVPLPDDDGGAGGDRLLSRAGSTALTDHAKTVADIAAAKRSSTPLQRQSLVPGQASVAPVTTRLGSAPPGIKRHSAPGIRLGSSLLPLHKSAPGLGTSSSLCQVLHKVFPTQKCHRHLG